MLLAVGSLGAFAEEIVPISRAQISTCDPTRMGCRAQIIYNGRSIQLNRGSLPQILEDEISALEGENVNLQNIEGFVKSTEQRPGTFRDEFYLVQVDTAADLSFCNERLMGCAPRITVNGEEALLDRDSLSDDVNRRINPTGSGGSITASIKGYFAYERGHFPNPMAYFRVFKILEINFPDSDIIDNSDRWYWFESEGTGHQRQSGPSASSL